MKVMNGLDLQGQKITALADPSGATDAANKQYVDNIARGLQWKAPVRAASTANISLAAPGANLDGVALAANDRILLKNQTAPAENGIWVWTASGAALTRAVDADNNAELAPGTTVTVTEGTVNADKAYLIVSDAAITVGTTSQTWGQLGGGTSYTASLGVQLVGSDFRSQVVAGGGVQAVAGGLQVDASVVVKKYAANIGNGALTTIAVTHNLGTTDVSVELIEVATKASVLADWSATDANTVTFTFPTAPAANAFRAVVHG